MIRDSFLESVIRGSWIGWLSNIFYFLGRDYFIFLNCRMGYILWISDLVVYILLMRIFICSCLIFLLLLYTEYLGLIICIICL